MGSFLSPIVRGKELRSEQTNISATQYIPHFLEVFMRDLLPEAPKSRECGIKLRQFTIKWYTLGCIQ